MSEQTFIASIRATARGIFNGSLDALAGADAMFSAIGRGYEQAWRDGAKSCGILADERTEEESKELARLIGDNYQYVGRFVEWVVQHSKANGGNWEMIQSRAFEWSNRYTYVETVAREMACKDQKEVWIYGPTEHCCDCLRMHGRVYRNSVWAKYGIEPRSPNLACFGGHCQCQRKPTDLPVTKGRPPALRGPGGCGKGKKKELST
jgi:hypothetical protein